MNGNSINLNGDVTNLSANAQTINNDLTMTGSDRVFATSAGTMTFNGVIGGGFALIKAGTGTVTLGGTNTFSGGTSIGAGTLGLANVDNGLKTNSTVTFTGNSTFDVGGTSQLLRNVVVTNSVTGNGKGTGTLSLSGADVIIGANTLSGATSTLDLRNLANLSFADSGHKFEVSGRGAGNTIETGVLYLAGTNSITASGFYVGNEDTSGNSGGGSDYTVGKAYLGNVNIINASTFQIGNVVNEGTVQFSSGRVSPTLTLRGTSGGSSRITNMYVGLRNSPWLHNGVGTFDLVTGVTGTSTLDALITTLYIGLYQRNDNGGLLTATLTMGGGTLDATTINLGVRNSSINNASGTVTSTLTVNGGTLKVTTLTSGNYASGNQVGTMTSTVNLNSNATMRAQSLQVGSGTATRTLNWNAGTIMNYSTNTDLTINSGLTTLALLTTGLHAFDIDSGRTGTVNQTMSGNGAITKAGLGVLSLATTNNYSGSTTLSNGVLRLATVNALSTNSAMVLAGGTLDARTYTNLVGSLTMGGNATILMGTNSATTLQFQDSSALPWSGTLNLVGTLGPVSVRFGTNRLGLTSSQKNQIIIGSRHVTLDPQGYVVLSTGTLMIVQ